MLPPLPSCKSGPRRARAIPSARSIPALCRGPPDHLRTRERRTERQLQVGEACARRRELLGAAVPQRGPPCAGSRHLHLGRYVSHRRYPT